MALPVRRREKDAFLSHAHVDKVFADQLYHWLQNVAGYNIWYDAAEMVPGTLIGKSLNQGIEKSRGLILLGTEEAFSREWVQKELAAAQVEDADAPDFRIIPIVVGNAKPGAELKGVSWIHAPRPELTTELADAILRAFHPTDRKPDPRSSRDVYISASWHPDDCTSARTICRKLISEGFRLIGDERNQKGFGSDRLESIIGSCGVLVSIVPFRGSPEANLETQAYKYFLREIDIAEGLNIPAIVFADPRLIRTDGAYDRWHRIETNATCLDAGHERVIESIDFNWRSPRRPHTIFLAADFDLDLAKPFSKVRKLIESISGMQTVVGSDLSGNYLQDEIMTEIKQSFLVIADLSGPDGNSFNLDVSIEAGIARAFGRNLVLLAKGCSKQPPFMLRACGQLERYDSELDMLGTYRRLVWPYRRRVINAEM